MAMVLLQMGYMAWAGASGNLYGCVVIEYEQTVLSVQCIPFIMVSRLPQCCRWRAKRVTKIW